MKNKSLRKSLAIVDDSETVREFVTALFTSRGVEVLFQAGNGQECLEKLASSKALPDTCLLDIDMPVMNGYATARQIKSVWPEVRIVMYSLYEDPNTVSKAKEAGADVVLSKNCDGSTLLAAI